MATFAMSMDDDFKKDFEAVCEELVFSFVNSLMYLEFAIPLRRACAI